MTFHKKTILLLFALLCVGKFLQTAESDEEKPNAHATTDAAFSGAWNRPLYRVLINKKRGYIDYSGKVVIPAKYNLANDFDNDGFAVVYAGPRSKPDDPFDFGKPAIINKLGEVVLEGGFGALGRGRFCIREGNQVRIVSLSGTFETNLKFNQVREGFAEGLLPVRIGDKWGFIDELGKLAIPATFDDVLEFREGLAAARLGEMSGYINHAGQWQIKPEFDSVDHFREGLARVVRNERCFYIDASGKRAFENEFPSAT